MKKIQTARMRNIGSHEISMPISDVPPSVGGFAVIVTPRSSRRLTSCGDVADLALVDLGEELRIGDVLAGGSLARILEEVEERDQDQPDDHPQRKVSEIRVHARPLSAPGAGHAPAPQ
jgi:hypothetical protein